MSHSTEQYSAGRQPPPKVVVGVCRHAAVVFGRRGYRHGRIEGGRQGMERDGTAWYRHAGMRIGREGDRHGI